MSTIKVNKIENTTTSAGGVAIDSSGHVQVDGVQMPTAGALTGRRLNINGAMQVAQRGTSYNLAHDDAALTVYATCDRYQFILANFDSYDCTITQSSDAPAGFGNSLKVETGTAEATVDADELFYIQHKIEGQDLQMLQNGSPGAKKVTLSFYVKTSQAGTYGVVLYKNDNTARSISSTYTTTTTDWEFVELTFDGDIAGGGIDDDNGEGFRLVWVLAAGSSWTSTDNRSWTNYTTYEWSYGHTQNGLATNASATWQLAGVQLEVGEKATPFEHRSFGDELVRCQRYYEKTYNYGVVPGTNTVGVGNGFMNAVVGSNGFGTAVTYFKFNTPKRTAPTTTFYHQDGTLNSWAYARNGASGTGAPTSELQETGGRIYLSVGSSWTVVDLQGHVVADAEL